MVQCHRVWAIQGTNYTLPTQGLRILAWLAYVLVSFDCHQEFVNPFILKRLFYKLWVMFYFLFFGWKISPVGPKKKKEGNKNWN
jgi:hypothetical protein